MEHEMTTREDFEKVFPVPEESHFDSVHNIYVPDEAMTNLWSEISVQNKNWRTWQACAAHYEAEQSKDYAEWIDERNTLLALIAEKDAALETVKNSGLLNGSFTLHDEIYDVVYEALSLTHDSVRLVKVESYDDMVCGDGPIYTIVKGE